ncbi:Extradiol ring-cleavage dioxygenase, class III enzyme, subunit B [Moelleriella libera RCEF 2490]|uniref:Extradiol ring-cleavage dioxygenase, class III enzyme, subunit B n=1 Tax=Moelleriella libera RCEF 2490 TaxID=1081109 RepID=A0A167Y3Z2_9HYPO|nr:Extradiol ring-cleavage dioxygenase, class III enzyme, subunit B [Moelleriella libera RCEF 2490]
MTVAPVIALSHGGGPLPLLGDKNHKAIIYSLQHRVPKILRLGTASAPKAIVLVTAHWTTRSPAISSGAQPSLYFDYHGFPPESYRIKYPAAGAPEIAAEIKASFQEQGLTADLDPSRGWDHGVFVPMTLVNPAADIPIVQMSVLASEDAEQHLRMGQALARLREKNIAIVGSGFASLHNFAEMRPLLSGGDAKHIRAFKGVSDEWNRALTRATTTPGKEDRWNALKGWRALPHADRMHPPRAGEHFMPLIVCAGAASDGEEAGTYKDVFSGVDIYTYYWGGGELD